jgi:hypothetical protein
MGNAQWAGGSGKLLRGITSTVQHLGRHIFCLVWCHPSFNSPFLMAELNTSELNAKCGLLAALEAPAPWDLQVYRSFL